MRLCLLLLSFVISTSQDDTTTDEACVTPISVASPNEPSVPVAAPSTTSTPKTTTTTTTITTTTTTTTRKTSSTSTTPKTNGPTTTTITTTISSICSPAPENDPFFCCPSCIREEDLPNLPDYVCTISKSTTKAATIKTTPRTTDTTTTTKKTSGTLSTIVGGTTSKSSISSAKTIASTTTTIASSTSTTTGKTSKGSLTGGLTDLTTQSTTTTPKEKSSTSSLSSTQTSTMTSTLGSSMSPTTTATTTSEQAKTLSSLSPTTMKTSTSSTGATKTESTTGISPSISTTSSTDLDSSSTSSSSTESPTWSNDASSMGTSSPSATTWLPTTSQSSSTTSSQPKTEITLPDSSQSTGPSSSTASETMPTTEKMSSISLSTVLSGSTISGTITMDTEIASTNSTTDSSSFSTSSSSMITGSVSTTSQSSSLKTSPPTSTDSSSTTTMPSTSTSPSSSTNETLTSTDQVTTSFPWTSMISSRLSTVITDEITNQTTTEEYTSTSNKSSTTETISASTQSLSSTSETSQAMRSTSLAAETTKLSLASETSIVTTTTATDSSTTDESFSTSSGKVSMTSEFMETNPTTSSISTGQQESSTNEVTSTTAMTTDQTTETATKTAMSYEASRASRGISSTPQTSTSSASITSMGKTTSPSTTMITNVELSTTKTTTQIKPVNRTEKTSSTTKRTSTEDTLSSRDFRTTSRVVPTTTTKNLMTSTTALIGASGMTNSTARTTTTMLRPATKPTSKTSSRSSTRMAQTTTKRLTSLPVITSSIDLIGVTTSDAKFSTLGLTTNDFTTMDFLASTGTSKITSKTSWPSTIEFENTTGYTTTAFAFQNIDTLDTQSTAVPDYCSEPCPTDYYDVGDENDFCYKLMSSSQTNTYSRSLAYCQAESSIRTLANTEDFLNKEAFDFFVNQTEGLAMPRLAFVNMLGSADFRNTHMVDLIPLSEATIYNLRITQQTSSSTKMTGTSAFCKAPKFCGPNNCTFQIFYDFGKATELQLPSNSTSVPAGMTVQLPCLRENSTESFNVTCTDRGEWNRHPTLFICTAGIVPIDPNDEETPFNKRVQSSCESCYWEGTKSCSYNETLDGYICNCKPGWTKFTCWQAPDNCGNVTCLHGSCVTVEEETSCECEPGYMGDSCEISKSSYSLFGGNGSLPYASLPTLNNVVLASTNVVVLIAKFISKVIIIGECEDPQDTYQDIRHTLLSIGNLAALFFTHPDMFGIDKVGCRFSFWFISNCYSLALLFWANESLNVYTTLRTLSKNKWGEDFEGNPHWFYTFTPRVIIPFAVFTIAILIVCARGWQYVATTWTCFGTFDEQSTSVWFPIMALNLVLVLAGFAFTEAACRVWRFRPYCRVRLHNWFAVNKPFGDETILKVERNIPFLFIGPPLLFSVWLSMALASDKNTSFFESTSFFLTCCYTVVNLTQTVFTTELYQTFTILASMYLPEFIAPRIDSFEKRTRSELLARYRKSHYEKEMNAKKEAQEAADQKMNDDSRRKNLDMMIRFPNLPQFLLFNIPEEGPRPCRPKAYPVPITDKNYVCELRRDHWQKRWTRYYLELRIIYKESPQRCANKIFKNEMSNGVLKQEKEIVEQAKHVWNEWYETVPKQDLFILTPHPDKLLIKEEKIDALSAFDQAISRVISIVDPWERHRRLQLLNDEEPEPFRKALNYLIHQPAAHSKNVRFPVIDNCGRIHFKEYLKCADILLPDQIKEMDKIYGECVAMMNEPFDKVYDDDHFLQAYKESPWSEAIEEIFKPIASRMEMEEGESSQSLNPRMRPIDLFWLDERRPDFIGPLSKLTVPLGPYTEYTKKTSYYQKLLDTQWRQIEHNAFYLESLEKLRRGKL